MNALAGVLVTASLLGGLLVFAGYPLLAAVRALGRKPDPLPAWDQPPEVTLLVVVRNGADLIEAKLRNTLALDYPAQCLRILVCSDGSVDDTARRVRSFSSRGVQLLEFTEHRGKNAALNDGIAACDTDILVFSDADALLAPDALNRLLAPLSDPTVGGVCGQRQIAWDQAQLSDAQSSYIRFDSRIKALESRAGSITSNDGKLYAARRKLLGRLPAAATDDLYNCLQVVGRGGRFVFEPAAVAFVRVPSRSPSHEIRRRRRIVARSLNGIALNRQLLDPRRSGSYALGLFINKVLRRLLPLFQIGLLLGSAILAPNQIWMQPLLASQLGFYGLALLSPWLPADKHLGRLAGRAMYFTVGSLGTLLGLMDFLRGRRPQRWDPLKSG